MPNLALPAVAVFRASMEAPAVVRVIVCTIYALTWATVSGIIAAKTGTFPLEMFLVFSVGLGAVLRLFKEKGSKDDIPAPEEKL